MDSESFQYCCGMEEVGNLHGTYQGLKAAIASRLKYLETERKSVEEGNGDFTPGGLIATTIPNQRGANRALKFHKFRKVFTFTNPGTGNKVTLWAKKLVR